MKEYTVYFEIYGKKMRTTVKAKSPEEAKDVIRNRITFHKVEECVLRSVDELFPDIDDLRKIFTGKGTFGA